MARKMNAATKNKIITKLISSPQGRKRIAATIQQPLREYRDYVSIGRKALMVDELPDGATPTYDKDIDCPAYFVTEEGDNVHKVIRGERVLVPLYEIASNPTVPFTQVKERRYDVVNRIKTKSRTELFRKEDAKIFGVLSIAGANNTGLNAPMPVLEVDFNMDVMADGFANIEAHGLRVDKVYMNPLRFKTFRKAGRDYLDIETQRELLRTGFMGNLWGADIYMSREVPIDTVTILSEPEFVGVLPVRIDLTVLPADEPAKRRFGWSVFEQIGTLVHNSEKGLQQIIIS